MKLNQPLSRMNKLFPFFAFLSFCPPTLFAQLPPELQNLEGVWYQTGRTSVCYSVWQFSDDQTLHNRTFSIVCKDTVEISRATVSLRRQNVVMTLQADSTTNRAPQTFRLSRYNNDELVWENENPDGIPRQIEWIFTGRGYATFRADGEETYFRFKRAPVKLQFSVSAGMNLSTFSNNHTPYNFLALQNVSINTVSYQRLPGQEIAFSAGLYFQETALRINFELGLAHRQVGVHASFAEGTTGYSRDGVYDYINTYFALAPEIFAGKKRHLSFSAGFYFDLAQQRNYRGSNSSSVPGAVHADPRQDIDVERGLLAGVSYRLPVFAHFQPALYVRNMFGLNNTRMRAISLGLSFQVNSK